MPRLTTDGVHRDRSQVGWATPAIERAKPVVFTSEYRSASCIAGSHGAKCANGRCMCGCHLHIPAKDQA